MPLFGGMGGNSNQGPSTDWGVKNFTTIIFVVGCLGLLAQIFLPNLWAEKMYDSKNEISDISIDGALRKKYTDASDPGEIHYILIVREKNGARKKFDFYRVKPNFFDQVAVPQRLFKSSGSLDVRVTRFTKPDTTLKIEFLED
jgi:hypothetical protein